MKLLNDPRNAVTEMLQGLVSSVAHLNRLNGFLEVRFIITAISLRYILCGSKALQAMLT